MIPKGTTHEFWRTIHAGADQAPSATSPRRASTSRSSGRGRCARTTASSRSRWSSPSRARAIDGIVLAPLDDKALVRPVEEAARLGVPTVIIDSALASDQIVSFVATDNYKGGELGADELGQAPGRQGQDPAAALPGGLGEHRSPARRASSRGCEAAWPGLELISSDQYAGATRDTAKRAAENLLNRYGKDLDGIFVVNESSTAGMLLALQDAGLAGKVKFVGFDSSQAFVDAMRNGQIARLRAAEPVPHGGARGRDARRPPAGQDGAQARRHRRLRRDAREPRRPGGRRRSSSRRSTST